MIHIVTRDNRRQYDHALQAMYAQRKALFIDELGWKLNEVLGSEIDEFDSEDALYLIEIDDEGAVLQSARLLPTTSPTMLGEMFAKLCDEPAPVSPHIWEASRFCPAPNTPKGPPRRALLGRMIAAILETGLLFKMQEVTFVASAALRPLATSAGWRVRALGPVVRTKTDRLSAYAAAISEEGLAAVRARYALGGPVADLVLKRAA